MDGMEQNINSVQVRVVEDDPKGITINVRNNPDKDGCSATVPTTAPPESEASNAESPPGEPQRPPSRKPKKKRDSIQYRDTGQWRDLVAKEWAAVAADESLAGMTLEQFKASTQSAITEREELDQLRGAVSGAIVRRKVEDQKVRKLTNRVINGIKASPRFGPDSDLYRRLGYVTDIERSSGLKRDTAGDSASPNP